MRLHVEMSLTAMLIYQIYLRYRVGLVDLPLIKVSVMMLMLGLDVAVYELTVRRSAEGLMFLLELLSVAS